MGLQPQGGDRRLPAGAARVSQDHRIGYMSQVFFWRISTAIVLLSAFNVWLAYHLETRRAEEPGREVMETIPAIGADLTDGSIIRHVKLEPVPHHIDARGRR